MSSVEKNTNDINNNKEPKWLHTFPKKDDVILISQPRRFAHDETQYDEQYKSEPIDLKTGIGLTNLLRKRGADFTMPALEIGAGSGKLSLGLVKENVYPFVILSDPSPAFLNIILHKLKQIDVDISSVGLAVLKGEEIDHLPEKKLSMIALRSTLHHILDVSKFIADSASALVPGGFLALQEPCWEGYVLMGTMAQFIPIILEKNNAKLSEHHRRQVKTFIDTMRFYARRDLDKAESEDKHLFRVDEIMSMGGAAGFTVEFLPNMTFEHYFDTNTSSDHAFSFHHFFQDYLKYCMNFDEELIQLFEQHFKQYNQLLEEISADNNAPYCHGIFLCRKL